MKDKITTMLGTSAWIVLGIAAAIVAIFLYRTIDSQWAQENHMTILMTIIFFAAAATAIVCGFNAATGNKHAHGHE